MEQLKQHSIFKMTAIVLLLSVLTPSTVKLAHFFENHKHDVCLGEQKAHFHSLDLDCEFYKFKLNNQFTVTFNDIELFSSEINQDYVEQLYSFKQDHQHLSFSLRAPPQLV